MTEAEAIEIASQFVREHGIETLGIKQALFVSKDRYDPSSPAARDKWAVYFLPPMPAEDQFDMMLEGASRDDSIILSVDVMTREADVVTLL